MRSIIRKSPIAVSKPLFFITVLTLVTAFLLSGCSNKDIGLTDVGSIVVDYASLKEEFKKTKVNWNKNGKNYSSETQKAVNTSIASIQIFYDTAASISRKRKILNIQDAYYDAIVAVKNIKNAIALDPYSTAETKQKAEDIYEKTVDMNSNVNLLYDKITGVKDNEKYLSILKLVISALKLAR